MGKEIVYCQDCGISLREDDFARGKAHTFENRPYCAECRAVPEAPPPPEPLPETRRETTTRKRKTSTAHIPTLGPASSKRVPAARPRGANTALIAGGAAGGLALLLLVAALASGGNRPRTPPPEREEPASSAARPEPSREPRPAPEPARRAPEQRQPEELKPPTEQDKSARIDAFLAQIREAIAADTAFERRAEIQNMISAARKDAGARADKLKAEYEKGFEEACQRLADFAASEARRLAAQKKFDEALAKIEEYPAAFGSTRHAEALRKLRDEIVGLQVEAALSGGERWGEWRVSSSTGEGGARVVASHAGRPNAYETHPHNRTVPAALERAIDVPAGKKSTLSFWVAPHARGDWELRAVVDGKQVLKQAVGPPGGGWKQVAIDLTPWAGKKVPVRLENAATDWSYEFGYWSDIEIRAE